VAKTAIVTGASKGIGRAIAIRLAQDGAQIVLCARGRDALDSAVREIELAKGRAIGAVGRPPIQFALELAEQHVPDPRHEIQFGGPDESEVLEQRRKVAPGREIRCAAVGERSV
jgi:NAD(P)-dependent dehydrogenase (short-subunit alcohol dehydrogenase family)